MGMDIHDAVYITVYQFTNKNTIFTEGFYLQWTKFLSIYILSLYINNYKKNKNKSYVQIRRYGYTSDHAG